MLLSRSLSSLSFVSSGQYGGKEINWINRTDLHWHCSPVSFSLFVYTVRATQQLNWHFCSVYFCRFTRVCGYFDWPAAALRISGKRKFDHITSTMRDDLHWLPVLCDNASSSSCVRWSASAFVALRRRTSSHTCASRCRQRLVARVYGCARAATSGFRAVDWQGMDREASPCLDPHLGTHCRCPSATCRNHLLSVVSRRLNYSVELDDNSTFVIAFYYWNWRTQITLLNWTELNWYVG